MYIRYIQSLFVTCKRMRFQFVKVKIMRVIFPRNYCHALNISAFVFDIHH